MELWKTAQIRASESWYGENYIVGDAKIKGLMCVLLGARAQCLVGS